MRMILICPYLQKPYLIPLGDFQTDFLELLVNGRREDRPPVLRRADDVIHQYRDVMTLVDELAHPHILAQQAAGN